MRRLSGLELNAPMRVLVSQYDLPANALQPGGSPVDTGDTRLTSATFRYVKIYAANTTRTVGGGGASLANPTSATRAILNANARWYVVTPLSATTYAPPATTYALTSTAVAYFLPGAAPRLSPGRVGGSH